MKSIMESQIYENTKFYLVDDGGNGHIFRNYSNHMDSVIIENKYPRGLRNIIIDFFEWAKENNFDYISKVDNDSIVPKDWLNDLINILETTKVDILSPNVSETNAAFKYGKEDTYNFGFRPSNLVGGLWNMKRELTDNIFFERADTRGIRGAFALLHQIIILNDPRPIVGWTDKVTFQDMGHWSGTHPSHIKSEEHAKYSSEIGRPIGWNVEAGR